MPFEVWSTVGAAALFDAINPTAIIILIVVLGRPNAFQNGLAYSVGMLGTHLLGGFAFAGTFAHFSTVLVDIFNDTKHYAGLVEAVLGLAALVMAWLMEADPRLLRMGPHEPSGKGLAGWVIIGFGVTMTKLVFAPVYVSQVGVIVMNAHGSFAWFLAGLFYYHLIAFFPFFLIWAIWIIWRDKSRPILGSLNTAIRTYTPTVMKYGLLALGIVLMVDGVRRNFGWDWPF